MGANLQEIEGRWAGERFRKGEFVIGAIELVNGSQAIADKIGHKMGEISCLGNADLDELEVRQTYRFYGRFESYKNKRTGVEEKQFKFNTFVPARAHDREGVIAYLETVGKGLGIGRATAAKAWKRYGSDAVRVIRDDPRQLLVFNSRITDEQLDQISQRLKEQAKVEDATIEITNLLSGRGLPKTTARKAIKAWGNRASDVIRRDPYALMRFRGVGFKLADQLWLELGLRRDRLRRQAMCVWHSLASDNNGHTWFPVQHAEKHLRKSIGPMARPLRAVQMAARINRLIPGHYGAVAVQRSEREILVDADGSIFLAEGSKADAERRLADLVCEAAEEADPKHDSPGFSFWPDPDDVENIDQHQRDNLRNALAGLIGILCGSPGTGKTHTIAQLIRAILRLGIVGVEDIAVGAPTGKAAVRISEALEAAGVPIRARTWHSLLGVNKSDAEDSGFGFLRNASNPWGYRIIIGDESSMIDLPLMASIFAARPRGCHFLLVGDVNQLPPVGNGAPLRDMIAAGVPSGVLTEIKRNSGGIVEACAAMRDGQPWDGGDNLKIIDARTPERQIQSMIDILAEQSATLDPVWDCQVLCAVNARSPLSRKIINQLLQAELNPNPEIKGSPFRLNDKIVCLKNGRYTALDAESDALADDENQVYVANGELARVIAVEDKFFVADLTAPNRRVRIPRGKPSEGTESESDDASGSGCSWDLAYALSCHKFQGSECPVVIVLIDEYRGAQMVCSREWLYTAFSRAKHICFMVGRKTTADMMCRNVAIGKRKTFLRQRIHLGLANRILETL